jgi:ssDNA-binding Zn-finger/Zn-ribbon topoisomerase 1
VGVELADIFRQHSPQYLAKYKQRVPFSHRKVIQAVIRCRTEKLGGQVYRCPKCEELVYRYHSCRNRHCPKCQYQKTQQWLEKQQDFRLPVPYFLLTFTLPDGMRGIARKHQKLIYQLLFQTSAAATQKLAQDPRFIGGKIGMIGAMHTWTRNLYYHPHVHYLVPAGGMTVDDEWVDARNNFMVPVKALSKLFRAKFRDALRKQDCFDEIPRSVWQQDWVVHCKPVGDGEAALKYLAPYIFRVAISNNRILKMEDGTVTFRYKATDTGKTKTCTLTAFEFIRRFLQHVLPKGFVKVRYYGFFSSGNRQLLSKIRQRLCDPTQVSLNTIASETQSSEQLSNDSVPCPKCGEPMELLKTIYRNGRSPPKSVILDL